MTGYTTHRQPTAADADLQGMVRWSPHHPGLLCRWQDVRPGEAWAHSSAWQRPDVIADALAFMDECDDVFQALADGPPFPGQSVADSQP